MKRELHVQSFIDAPTWDTAKWHGTAYLTDPAEKEPPVMGFLFGDEASGRTIFEGWRSRLGEVDEFEELRVSIIEGPISGQPEGYSVLVTSEPPNTVKRAQANGVDLEADEVIVTARFHRMEPGPNSPHLDNFKRAYLSHGCYLVAPVKIVSGSARVGLDVAIRKSELYLRAAGEVAVGEIESIVLPKVK